MQVRGVAGRPFGVGSSTTTFRSVWHTTVNELLFMVVELLQMYGCCAQTGDQGHQESRGRYGTYLGTIPRYLPTAIHTYCSRYD